jgi:hypothetical protein
MVPRLCMTGLACSSSRSDVDSESSSCIVGTGRGPVAFQAQPGCYGGSLQSAFYCRYCRYGIAAPGRYGLRLVADVLQRLVEAVHIDDSDTARSSASLWTPQPPPGNCGTKEPWRSSRPARRSCAGSVVPSDRSTANLRYIPPKMGPDCRSFLVRMGSPVIRLVDAPIAGWVALHSDPAAAGVVEGRSVDSRLVGTRLEDIRPCTHPDSRLGSSGTKQQRKTRQAEESVLRAILGHWGIAAKEMSWCTCLGDFHKVLLQRTVSLRCLRLQCRTYTWKRYGLPEPAKAAACWEGAC